MRYGRFLPAGGNIGFIAPSFGCSIEPYKSGFMHALEKFEEMGYTQTLGPNCFKNDGIGISTNPKDCAAELTAYLTSGDSDVLIACGGGELMCEILPYVDFERIKAAPPKLLMGYSDITNMAFLLPTLCDTAAVYGPCAGTFGMEPWDESLQDAFSLLTGEKLTVRSYDTFELESLKDEEHPTVPYNRTEKRVLVTEHYSAPFSGRLLGGCLDCLSNLVGTRFDGVKEFNRKYKEDGVIWFLEACDLNVFSIRRSLWQLRNAGWFETAKGFLIGRPRLFDQPEMGLDRISAVTGALSDLGLPILLDLDIGHLPPQMPLLVGSLATVSVSGNDVEIRMETV